MKVSTTLLTVLSLTVFTLFIGSCKKEENPPPDQLFSFALTAGTGYISGDATLKTGEQFKVGINALAASGNLITRFRVVRLVDKPSDVIDTTLNASSLNFDFFGIANDEIVTENWTFTVTQSNGDSLTESFVITTEPSMGPIVTYDQRILGFSENVNGSAFSSSDGTIYDLLNAKTNASFIDLLYFYGDTTFSSLASPDDDEAAHVFTDGGTYSNPGPNALLNWSPRNQTRLKKITYQVDWDSIQDDTPLFQLTQGAVESHLSNLKPGFFVAFITTAGKKGLIRINSIMEGESGQIDISVKVQQ